MILDHESGKKILKKLGLFSSILMTHELGLLLLLDDSEMGVWGGDIRNMERLEREISWEGRDKGVRRPLDLGLDRDDWRQVEQTDRNRRASIEELRRIKISPRSSAGSSDQSPIDERRGKGENKME